MAFSTGEVRGQVAYTSRPESAAVPDGWRGDRQPSTALRMGMSYLHARVPLPNDWRTLAGNRALIDELSLFLRNLQVPGIGHITTADVRMAFTPVRLAYLYLPAWTAGSKERDTHARRSLRFAVALTRDNHDLRVAVEAEVDRFASALDPTNPHWEIRESGHGSRFRPAGWGTPRSDGPVPPPESEVDTSTLTIVGQPPENFVLEVLTALAGESEAKPEALKAALLGLGLTTVDESSFLMCELVGSSAGVTAAETRIGSWVSAQTPDLAILSKGEAGDRCRVSISENDAWWNTSRAFWVCWKTIEIDFGVVDAVIRSVKRTATEWRPRLSCHDEELLLAEDMRAAYVVSRAGAVGDGVSGRARINVPFAPNEAFFKDVRLNVELAIAEEMFRVADLLKGQAEPKPPHDGKVTNPAEDDASKLAKFWSLNNVSRNPIEVYVGAQEPSDGAWLRLMCTRA